MERHAHGGDIYGNVISHDFSINLNPLGMPEQVVRRLRDSVEDWGCYPDPECRELTGRLARFHKTEPSRIFCGNGAAELICLLVQVKRPKKALVPAPAFFEYERALRSVGCQVEYYHLEEQGGFVPDMENMAEKVTEDTDMVFFCNPNNPTGVAVTAGEIRKLAKACHQNRAFLVVDECFCEFLENPEQSSAVPLTADYPQMAVLRAFTKTFAMAGLRLGYGICREAGLWEQLYKNRQPWSVSLPAQVAGVAALEPQACGEYLERTRELLRQQREALTSGLEGLGFKVYPSNANYLLFKAPWEIKGEADSLYEQCRLRGILIRDCKNFTGLTAGYYRVCVGRQEENLYLLEQLGQILDKGEGRQ